MRLLVRVAGPIALAGALAGCSLGGLLGGGKAPTILYDLTPSMPAAGAVTRQSSAGTHRTENGSPYTLAGDTDGDYRAWTPGLGDHVLRAFSRPLADVKVLVVGQDPYPTPGHAVGLGRNYDYHPCKCMVEVEKLRKDAQAAAELRQVDRLRPVLVGAQAQRLEHVRAALDAAVHQNIDAIADSINDLSQLIERRPRAVELPATGPIGLAPRVLLFATEAGLCDLSANPPVSVAIDRSESTVFRVCVAHSAGLMFTSMSGPPTSPRGSIAFFQAARAMAVVQGRHYVIPEDVRELRHSVLRHRIHLSFEALADRVRPEMVIDADAQLDQMEIEIEEQAIELLALQQPMARDLRFIISAIKITSDLERVGDHAVNIAQAATRLIRQRSTPRPTPELEDMARRAREMLGEALDAFLRGDGALGRAVCLKDDQVDALHESLFRIQLTHMLADPRTINDSLDYLAVSRNLERVADLATNIGEDAVFVAEGKTIKHGAERNRDR